jgi:hypothetical protein
VRRQPQSHRLDAKYSAPDVPNPDEADDGQPAGERLADADGARPVAVQQAVVGDARPVDGRPGDGKGDLHPAAMRVDPVR